jgi:hypothetical protein
MKQKLKIIASIIFIVPALIWLFRLFSATQINSAESPNAAKKKVAEAELAQTEKEIEKLEEKVYTDNEILDKWNK